MEINKAVNPGKVEVWQGRNANYFCCIKFSEGKLSITGVVGPRKSGNAYSCGQTRDEVIKVYNKGWNEDLYKKFQKTWDEWHLNYMRPGCEHQRMRGWEKDGYDKHPSQPCPVCGYKFGSAWKKVEIPQDVLDFLLSLPDTKITPAWI